VIFHGEKGSPASETGSCEDIARRNKQIRPYLGEEADGKECDGLDR
jgi:hypothetical protein